MDEVILLAEYTTSEGPMIDDHFIYALFSDGRDKSFPVEDLDKPSSEVKAIEEALDIPIECKLCNRTDFCSRAIYPRELSESEIFQIVKKEKNNSFLQRVLSIVGTEVAFTEEVMDLLRCKGIIDQDGYARPRL
ncbi:MAG: hypothetical protein CML13_19495 [Puniceicoccaceae bacterium]|nr:hypothetical protein [Puniceicoccaceae bacterium]